MNCTPSLCSTKFIRRLLKAVTFSGMNSPFIIGQVLYICPASSPAVNAPHTIWSTSSPSRTRAHRADGVPSGSKERGSVWISNTVHSTSPNTAKAAQRWIAKR